MKPKFYVGTIGMSVWFTEDLGETWARPNSEFGMSNEARIWALSSHPAQSDHVLAGTDRGIHRWSEAEGRWQHLPSQLDGMHVWALQHAPHDSDLVFAGTSPGAMFRSDDGGVSWCPLDIVIPEICMYNLRSRVTQIAFDPLERDAVWMCVEIDAIHRSRDGGRSWSRLGSGLATDDVHGISVMRRGQQRVVLAAVNRGLHRSTDDGASFERLELPGTPWQYTRAVAAKADGSGTVFVTNGEGPPGSWGRLFRSRDWGDSWEELQLPARTNSTLWTISVHPHDPELVFVCSNLGQIFRSFDGGDSWVKLERELGEIRCAHWRSIP